MTPSEKPSRTGSGVDPDADRTTVLPDDARTEPTASDASDSNGRSDLFTPDPNKKVGPAEGNGGATSSGPERESTAPAVEREEALELSHAAVPPPWQRMTTDAAAYVRQPMPSMPSLAMPTGLGDRPTVAESPGEQTIDQNTEQLRRPSTGGIPIPPVGAAAPRAFPDYLTAGGQSSGPARTTVHLEGAGGTARPAMSAAAPSALRRPGRGPRRANLQIKRFDPWSVLKLSLVLGVALFFVWLVAVGALYAVLDGMGVWDKINGISTDLLQGNEANSEPLISAGRVFGIAAIVGAVNIVLFSALATVGAFVYNVSADLAGGLEVTLAERE